MGEVGEMGQSLLEFCWEVLIRENMADNGYHSPRKQHHIT